MYEHAAFIFRVDIGDSRFLLSVGTYLPDYTVSHPRRDTRKKN
jgi:hypothetical protein